MKGINRRKFLGQVGMAVTAAAAALASPLPASAQVTGRDASNLQPLGCVTNGRVIHAFELRVAEATQDASAGLAKNVNNGDEALYTDKAGTYTKGLQL